MRNWIILGGLIAAVSLTACKQAGDALDQASDKAAAVMKDVGDALASVKDSDTAKAAEKKLDALIAKLKPAMDKVKTAMKDTAAKAKDGADAAAESAKEGASKVADKSKELAKKGKAMLTKAWSSAKTKIDAQIQRLKGNDEVTPELQQKVDEVKRLIGEG